MPAADTVRAEVDATSGRATGHHGAVQPPTVSYVDVGPVRLAYESFGDPSHPLVLLLMGQGTQMLAWADPFCTRLAERGLHVVRFDNRDIGLSTHLPRKGLRQYTLDDLAGDTLGLLDALGVHRAHLVGLSMGGMIAQLVAIGAPERVLSMTCIGSSTGSRRVGRPKPALLRRLPLRRSVSDRDGAGELFARIIAAIGSPAYPGDPERLRDLGARAFDRGSHPRGALRQLLAVIRAPDRTPGLRRVQVPTLVVHGADDPLVHVSGGRAIADAVPGARLVTVPGMGHDLPPALWPLLIDEIAAVVARGERRAVGASQAPTELAP